MHRAALLSCGFLLSLASSFSLLVGQTRKGRSSWCHHLPQQYPETVSLRRYSTAWPLFAVNKRQSLSAAEQARRDEERRRRERSEDVIIGKTSAKPGEIDFALDVQATEEAWMRQASNVEQEVFRRTEQGMQHLKMFQVEQANTCFDAVFALKPNAYLWQAGIAKFYLHQLEDAAERLAMSGTRFERRFGEPATEERIWRNACQLKLQSSVGKQERQRLQQLPGGLAAHVAQIPSTERTNELLSSERRKVLRLARQLFDSAVAGDKSAAIVYRAQLRSICGAYEPEPKLDKKLWNLTAWFYLGLYHDVVGHTLEAKKCLKMALRLTSSSAGKAQDLVHTLPMLHMARRDWFDDDDDLERDLFGTADKKAGGDNEHATPLRMGANANDDPIMLEALKEGVDELIVEELREALRIRGISCVGSKEELRNKLLDSLMRDAGFGPKIGFSS